MKISVKVITHKDNPEIVKLDENNFVVKLKCIPEKGKANKELIKLLAKNFNVPSCNVSIKTGHTSKNKIIEIKSN